MMGIMNAMTHTEHLVALYCNTVFVFHNKSLVCIMIFSPCWQLAISRGVNRNCGGDTNRIPVCPSHAYAWMKAKDPKQKKQLAEAEEADAVSAMSTANNSTSAAVADYQSLITSFYFSIFQSLIGSADKHETWWLLVIIGFAFCCATHLFVDHFSSILCWHRSHPFYLLHHPLVIPPYYPKTTAIILNYMRDPLTYGHKYLYTLTCYHANCDHSQRIRRSAAQR